MALVAETKKDPNMKNIVIIDYQNGNIFSLINAFKILGFEVNVTSDHREIIDADGIVLPGVGAFGTAMKSLAQSGLDDTIREFAATGKKIMGICLGMQLLFEESCELGSHMGLGLIKGNVLRFPEVYEHNKLNVPHTGWSQISLQTRSGFPNSPLKTIHEPAQMYFVHSFYVRPSQKETILTTSVYAGFQFCSSVEVKNLFATQFHPEKSGKCGLSILKNWAEEPSSDLHQRRAEPSCLHC
jgi:glutamine amidotransferase